jgi:transformation/transcription domain-associated protein
VGKLSAHPLWYSNVALLIDKPDPKIKYSHAIDLRDSVEFLCNGTAYAVFLQRLLPIFKKILEGPPVFVSTSWMEVRLLFPP